MIHTLDNSDSIVARAAIHIAFIHRIDPKRNLALALYGFLVY